MSDVVRQALALAHKDFPLNTDVGAAKWDDIQKAVHHKLALYPGGMAWACASSNGDMYLLSCNDDFAEQLGLDTQEPQNVKDLNLSRTDLKRLAGSLAQAAETGQRVASTINRHITTEEQRTILISVSRLSDAKEVPARLMISSVDVTERRRVELVARHATELLRAMIDGVQEYAVFMLNEDGTVASWNAGAARLTGRTGPEMVGEHISKLNMDDSESINWSRLVHEAETQYPFMMEGWMSKTDGFFWGTATCTPVFSNGNKRGFAVMIHDLTEKLSSEQAIRASEQRFKDFAESASDWFWETDKNLCLKYLSPTFEDRLGIDPSYLLGKAHFQFSDLHEGADEWWEHLRALNAHKPFRDFRYTITLPNGRTVHITDSGKPLFNEAGKFIGYRGAGRDITHEVKAREAANTIAHRFFSAMDTASEAILLFDADRRLVFWNRRTVALFPLLARRLTSGLRYNTLLHVMGKCTQDDQDFGPRGLRSVFNTPAGKNGYVTELRFEDTRHFRVTERHTHEGGVTLVMSDITQEMAREQQIRQSYKMEALGQLTGGVAHDFNNLLTVVGGNLEMVEPHLEDSPKLSKRIQNALDAVTRGADLTGRLLGFARQQPAESQIINIAECMSTLTPLLRQAVGNSVQFHQELSDVGVVEVDASQFDNAILNLCINARDAMPEGGTLRVTLESYEGIPPVADYNPGLAANHWVRLQVQDTGFGMKDDVIQRAFDPFFTTKEHGKGSGLGLSMVYGFIRRSGGQITIDSKVGLGTTVSLYLPLKEAPEHTESPVASGRADLPKGTETILVVEDNAQALEVISAMLDDLGYVVETAPSGREAVELLRSGARHDLVLTDFSMPGGMTGLDVCKAAMELQPHMPVILMSGYAELIPDTAGTPMATAKLIHKPFSLAQLSQVVRDSLERA